MDLQKIIGISKKIRLENTLTNLQEIGVSFGAPMLLPYVQWILNIALKNSIRCLYFIARDGYVLQKMTDMLIQAKKLILKQNTCMVLESLGESLLEIKIS